MKISVVLTSYNHDRFLRDSIESVINQTYQGFEFIIVDDFSTDNSWEIISEYQRRYQEIIAVQHDYNWGTRVVEGAVKEYASGDYIAICHSDDLWMPDKLEKQVRYFKENKDCVAVFTNAMKINDAGMQISGNGVNYQGDFQGKNRNRFEWLRSFFYEGNSLCHPSILIKRKVYEEDDFFRKGLRQIPDFVKWIQVCKKYEIGIIEEPLVQFRIHENRGNISGISWETAARSATELFLMLGEYADIDNYDDFIKIFPEASVYCDKDHFYINYAFGRLCIQDGMPNYTRLFGYTLLYRMFNNPSEREMVGSYFNYSIKDFLDETGRHDIFGILPLKSKQVRTLYYDLGEGFNENNCIKESFYFQEKEEFNWRIVIKLPEEGRVVGLRFDPAEGVMIKGLIKKAKINGTTIQLLPENALDIESDEDVFLNLDPMYVTYLDRDLLYSGMIEVQITGRIERIIDTEINELGIYMNMDNKNLRRELVDKEEQVESICNYRKCVVCGNVFDKYVKIEEKFIQNREALERSVRPEMLNYEEYSCPRCYSADRDRMIVLFINALHRHTDQALKFLEIAPSGAVWRYLASNWQKAELSTADLYMDNVDYQIDIQDMAEIVDDSFDFIVCSHVLEHVQSDSKAIRELHRVLDKNGLGIIIVPIDLNQEYTDEEWGLSAEENLKRFGQEDHVRRYNKQNYIERLQQGGFSVHEIAKDFFTVEEQVKNALTDTATLYLVYKNNALYSDIHSVLEKYADIHRYNEYLSSFSYNLNGCEYWVDVCSVEDNQIIIWGWAYFVKENSRNTKVKLLFKGEKNVNLLNGPVRKREDISTIKMDESQCDYSYSGIDFVIPINQILDDTYEVLLLIMNASHKTIIRIKDRLVID